jgi:hypothetical protein
VVRFDRGTLVATFQPAGALSTEQAGVPEYLERTVFSCDYNGWADVPEEKREGLDAFEATPVLLPKALLQVRVVRGSISHGHVITHRRAA